MSVFDRAADDEFSRGAITVVAYPDIDGVASVDASSRLEEARGLAAAIGLDVVESRAFRVRSPRPATLFGGGQVETISELIEAHSAQLLVVDGDLSAIQQRNLETATGVKVIDRTGLILEIFGERANTAEGRLQVELAHLDYQAGRLVRSWTHLERQRGGFGFLGGPGETQIEADRRMIRDRMAKLRRQLSEVKRTRSLHRARRQRAPWPVIALVGYTNAGKSTLFNRLTGSDVFAQDLLFATLDPTMREISLPGLDKAILSDTVGFVSNLPTELIAAFRATLEEVRSADLIVHVRDISDPDTESHKADVENVLNLLGFQRDDAEEEEASPHDEAFSVPMLEAWNKIDTLDDENYADVSAHARPDKGVIAISAVTGEGVEDLRSRMSEMLTSAYEKKGLLVPAAEGKLLAWLHENGQVDDQHSDSQGDIELRVSLAPKNWDRFEKMAKGTGVVWR